MKDRFQHRDDKLHRGVVIVVKQRFVHTRWLDLDGFPVQDHIGVVVLMPLFARQDLILVLRETKPQQGAAC